MGGPAIVVTGLRKSFGPKEAVAGIDLQIAAGSLAGLVGPNGAVTPVILAVVFTASAPTAIRLPLLILAAAAYGLALAWGGVRGAALIAERKLPELAQIAIRSALKGACPDGWLPGAAPGRCAALPPGARALGELGGADEIRDGLRGG